MKLGGILIGCEPEVPRRSAKGESSREISGRLSHGPRCARALRITAWVST